MERPVHNVYGSVQQGLHTAPPQVEAGEVQLEDVGGNQKETRFLRWTSTTLSWRGGRPLGRPRAGGRAGQEPGGI